MKKICISVIVVLYALNVVAQDIYSAGNDGKLGKTWKNGLELHSVADGTNSVGFDCVFVSGNDVYTGGGISNDNHRGAIWKNGVLLYYLTPSTVNLQSYVEAVAVSNGNVYACGSESTDAVLWKNGTKTILGQGYYNSYSNYTYYYAESMQVIGNDVYVVGYSSNAQYYTSGYFWKNETQSYIANARFYAIAVLGSDTYIAGQKYDTNEAKYIATVWKNGEEFYTASDLDYFSAITVSDNDVYVCGYTKNGYNSSNKFAKVWKNGEVIYQLSDGTTDTRCTGIVVHSNDVFALTRSSQDAIWKNDVELYGFGSATVNAICLSSKVAAVENTKSDELQVYVVGNELHFNFQNLEGLSAVIYDISGHNVGSAIYSASKNSIDISNLSKGVYIVKIGGKTAKFVKTT